jgi:1-acyl-sn-glycerol-3-phosphate acyltransferase
MGNTIINQQQILKDRGICVIIPTYNNAGTIVDIVTRSLNQCKDVIVVCDGCTDNTIELLNELNTKPIIINLEKNQGKGTALKKGFKHALKLGFSYAITLDGDGQHYPEDISIMLEANMKYPGALIVGERKNLESVERSAGSKFANSFSNFWFAIQTAKYLKDTQTGYRLYPLKKLYGLSFLTSRYEAELELMVFASWHGVKLVSVPVNVFYPSKEERISHFHPIKDFFRIFLLNTILCFLAVIYGLPIRFFQFIFSIVRSIYSLLFFVIGSMFVMTPLVYIYLTLGKITEQKKYNLHRIFNFMAKFVLLYHKIPGIKYKQNNPYNETFKKPSVIICNHSSHLDLMPLLALTEKVIILTADWVWKNPIYKFAIRNAEFLPASLGVDVMMPQLKSIVERGYSIAIYPEGTRSLDCNKIGRFHQGAFYIAQTLNIDVVPLILYGTGHALPKKGRRLNKWKVYLEVDKRISPLELKSFGTTTKEQAIFMRDYYKKRYRQIANKIEQNV